MEILLFAGILLVILALLGFGGVIGALRHAAWLILVLAIAMIVIYMVI